MTVGVLGFRFREKAFGLGVSSSEPRGQRVLGVGFWDWRPQKVGRR